MTMHSAEATTRRAFQDQSSLCNAMGSPFTATLCRLFAEREVPHSDEAGRALYEALYEWTGNPGYTADVLPLRLTGALHSLVLSGDVPSLKVCYPPNTVSDNALWQAVLKAIKQHSRFVIHRLGSAPQTNEVQRSGVIAAGLACLSDLSTLPISLLEIGASAGLNLFPDAYSIRLDGRQYGDPESPVLINPEWRGNRFQHSPATIATRAGCDLMPIRLQDDASRDRLLSYIWPDQFDRLQRTRDAIDIIKTNANCVVQSDAASWLQSDAVSVPTDYQQVVMHTVVWQYMSQSAKQATQDAIYAMGAKADAVRKVAWFRLEADTSGLEGGALLLDYWDGGSTQPQHHVLGRADFHGRWIDWVGLQ